MPHWRLFPGFSGKTSLYQAGQQAGKRTSLACNMRINSPITLLPGARKLRTLQGGGRSPR